MGVILKSYDDTYQLKIEPYTVNDPDGNVVTIMPKNPGNHTLTTDVELWAPVFHNLGAIVMDPTRVYPSTSKNPQAIEHRKKGKVMVYEKEGLIENLGFTNLDYKQQDLCQCIVMYEDSGSNYTLTYHIFAK